PGPTNFMPFGCALGSIVRECSLSVHEYLWSIVGQPGGTPRSGRGGRRFKSCHSDQPRAGQPVFPQVSANTTGLQARRVHQRVHQHRLRMASLRQDSRGNYVSRKKLPLDVRDEYGKQFGQRHEAKFFRPASTDRREAQQQFSEWSAEVDGNVIAIRAARDGTGLSLTPAQARRLAGEWYTWWTARHAGADKYQIGYWRDRVVEVAEDVPTVEALREAQKARTPEEREAILTATLAEAGRFTRDELWEEREDVREAVRPVLADIGETAQFLAAKRIALT